MSRYNLINSALGWITFVIALITYTLTLEPTVSFWDCGEFISASYRLQICHPPGAPLFLMIGRLYSLMAGSDVTHVAFWVNMVSATTSALCIMFYFWTITHLAKKILVKTGEADMQQTIAIMMSGLIGSLALSWSDTFWFSAVEAEVYASSSFFTALTFWCILKWENVAHEKHADRWVILIAYLIGLAIGVHLLNLLVIPAIVYVYYFKKYQFTQFGFIKATAVALLAIAAVQFVMIPGIPWLMTRFDLLFVNSFGMGFNSGSYFTLIFLAGLLGAGLYWSFIKHKVWLNTIILCATFIIIGYSSYAMILIRSAADPVIDMNNPEQPFSLSSYINREQYGDNPLIYGQYFYAKVVDYKKGSMQYRAGENGKYIATGPSITRVFDPKDCTILPRMWADRADYVQSYRAWEKIPEGKKATFGKNMHFMFDYQLGFMYWRYFFWNVIGRQNDDQGFGDVTRGNWLSGIKSVDAVRLGPQDNMPDSMSNKAHNTYFFLPLILGILGLIFHFRKAQEDAIVILTLFLFTGAFIVLYLNFPAHQPRERDYAYVGSFQTFFIWVGLGVLALIDFLTKKLNRTTATAIGSIASLSVPLILVNQNWDDHNRSNRYTAVDFATNYLESCPKNAILFTNGDNDTYPLWYAQNVEGIRSDVRVINLSLLNTDWYTNGLKRQAYESAPVPFSMTPDKYVQGVRDYVMYYNNPAVEKTYGINQTDFYPLKNIIAFVNDDKDPMAKLSSQGGEQYSYYPTKKFFVKIDKEQVLKAGVVQAKDAQYMVDSIKFEIGNNNLMKADLVTLDIVASTDWTRPICFAITTGSDVYLNMQNYFQINGLVYQLTPIINNQPSDGTMGRINSDVLYDNVMHKFKWGNMDKPGVYLDETILRQTKNLRNLFYRLATKLVEEGDTAKAKEVLAKCLVVMPKSNVPYDVFVVRLAEAAYTANDITMGNQLVRDVYDTYADKYTYYSSFKAAGKASLVKSEIDEAGQIMGYCMQVAQFHKQDALANEIKAKMDTLQIQTQ